MKNKILEKACKYAEEAILSVNHRSDACDAYYDGYQQALSDIYYYVENIQDKAKQLVHTNEEVDAIQMAEEIKDYITDQEVPI